MRARLSAIVAAAGIAVAVVPAHAGSVPATAPAPAPQITDPVGDANFVNGQSLVDGVPDEVTPVEESSADITGVLFQTTFVNQTVKKTVVTVVKKKKVKKTITVTVKVPTGFTLTMKLAAAPGPETEYRVTAAKGACTGLFFEYSTDAATDSALGGSTDIRCASGEETTKYTIDAATVTGNSITWQVPLSQVPLGTKLTDLGAMTALNPVLLTVPFYDLASSSATFTVGQ